MPITSVEVRLVSEDGNSFAILGRVKNALKKAGRHDLVDEYIKEATSGDYSHLIVTTMKYVKVV